MLRWVFLDVGNVLMNDDPAMALLYRELHGGMCACGYRISFRELLGEREELIRLRGPEHWQLLGRKYLGEEGHRSLMLRCASMIRSDYMASHCVIPGMDAIVKELSEQYRIGVIANQLRESVDALEAVGLGRFVEVYAVSEIVGIRKPHPGLYRWALEQAGCEPHEAVMVGDRVDNDIVPARALGMWTILLRIPHEARGYTPSGEMERQYFESQLRASIGKIDPASPEQMPDGFASSSAELHQVVERIRKTAASPSGFPAPGR